MKQIEIKELQCISEDVVSRITQRMEQDENPIIFTRCTIYIVNKQKTHVILNE